MAHDVFISYSSKDKPVADAVCAGLEAQGVRCWIAPRDIVPGQLYGECIVKAIHECRLLALVFSAHSNQSPQVMREVERAVSLGLPILPFRIEDVPLSPSMEYFISAPHWLDAITPPLDAHLDRLAQTAKLILAGGEPDARSPRATTSAAVTPPATASPPNAASPRFAAPTDRPADKNPLPLALAGTAVAILVLGGVIGIAQLQNRGKSERQRVADAASSPRQSSSANITQEPTTAPSAATGDSTAAPDATASRSVANLRGKVGDELTDGKWRFQVLDHSQVSTYTMKRTTEADYAQYRNSAEFDNNTFAPKPGNVLLVFHCRVVNAMPEKQALWHYDNNTALRNDQGESFPPIAVDIRGGEIQSEPILPGSNLEFTVLFSVPQGTKPKELIFTLKAINDKQGADVHISL